MNSIQDQYKIQSEKYKCLVWDYDLTPKDFFAILYGDKTMGWFDRKWATVRVLENAPYYDAIELIEFGNLAELWPKIKISIFNKTIRHGYEYVLQKRAVSFAGSDS